MTTSPVAQDTELAVDLHGVSKVFRGNVHALREVDMQIRMGEIFGLLGPNGAGKSTLVKIMMTVVRPTAARGTILGAPLGNADVLGRIGYLPEHHRFPAYLTGRQVIEFFGALCKVPRARRKARADELLALVGMRAWGDKRMTQYSKGMQQRIGIAVALVNDPKLVVLDEPTDGLDPMGRRDVRDLLLRLRDEGRSVLVNSHLLGEVEMVADRVAIMNKGQVLTQGTLEELTRTSQRYEVIALRAPVRVETAVGVFVGEPHPDAADRLVFRVSSMDLEHVQHLLDALRAVQAHIAHVEQMRETLEDLFVRSVVDEQGKHTPGAALGEPPRRSDAP